MRILLMALVMILFTSFVIPNEDINIPLEPNTEISVDNQLINYTGWQQSIPEIHYNQPAFYYAIFRTQYPIDRNGNYEYQVWFSSASYIWDYHNKVAVKRDTYINGIYLAVNTTQVNQYPKDIVVYEARPLSSLKFYTNSTLINYQIIWGGVRML